VIVDGGGLIATAFLAHGNRSLPGVIFARGVPDSTRADELAFARERRHLRGALARARGVDEPLVYFSGAPIAGSYRSPVSETTAPVPRTPYGWHQRECEEIVHASRVPHLILRLPNVVGPGGNPHQLVPALVQGVIEGRVTVYRRAARDLLDVEDLVAITGRLLAHLSDGGVIPGPVIVASGVSIPARMLVERICELLGRTPQVVLRRGGEAQRFDIGRLRAIVGDLPFDDGYPERVLDRHVPSIAAAIHGW
jgi:nucleoside-diphosphate-sugar epimerase